MMVLDETSVIASKCTNVKKEFWRISCQYSLRAFGDRLKLKEVFSNYFSLFFVVVDRNKNKIWNWTACFYVTCDLSSWFLFYCNSKIFIKNVKVYLFYKVFIWYENMFWSMMIIRACIEKVYKEYFQSNIKFN